MADPRKTVVDRDRTPPLEKADANTFEGRKRAASMRELSEIVGKHPDETLTVMRGWMARENG